MKYDKKQLKYRFILVFLIIFYLSIPTAAKTPPEMWGDLRQGPYDIGFRTIFTYDLSRPSIPYSDWDGKLY
ncbi:MAG: hypothetical protein GY940_04030, partial [bacterium]|nr:hypothetical protein [bacterium]